MSTRHIYPASIVDQLLISCPIVVPIVYLALIGQFPAYEALIFLAFVVLLGETHFGLTWLFFLDKENLKWAARRPLYSVVIPAVMTVGFLFVYFAVDSALAILLSSVFSAYHVTMQSVGIMRLYGGRNAATDIAAKIILGCSALFLLIGFLRFYNPVFDSAILVDAIARYMDPSAAGTFLVLALIAGILIFCLSQRRQGSSSFFLATLTGSMLYSPYLFASRPEHAIAMGVGMHWCQYLAINFPIYVRKTQDGQSRKIFSAGMAFWQICLALLVYSLVMGYFRIDHDVASLASYDFSISYLIVIPLVFQNLHYYSEMFTWKFSDPHIRERVGGYIFAPAHEVREEAAA